MVSLDTFTSTKSLKEKFTQKCYRHLRDCPPPKNEERPLNQASSSSLINNDSLVCLVCHHQMIFDCRYHRYQLKKEERPDNSPYVVVQVC